MRVTLIDMVRGMTFDCDPFDDEYETDWYRDFDRFYRTRMECIGAEYEKERNRINE